MMLIGCIIVLILLSRAGAGSGAGGSVVDRVIDFFKGGKSAESSDSASVGSLSRAGGKTEELGSNVIDAK